MTKLHKYLFYILIQMQLIMIYLKFMKNEFYELKLLNLQIIIKIIHFFYIYHLQFKN